MFALQSEAQRQLEEMKAFRSKMKEVADEARQKEDLQKQLVRVLLVLHDILINTTCWLSEKIRQAFIFPLAWFIIIITDTCWMPHL